MNSYIPHLDILGRPEYNQFITCPRTHTRVSFAETGEKNKATLLFIVPSFSSRLIGAPLLAPLAEHYGVRVISIDRPGCGGEIPCSSHQWELELSRVIKARHNVR
jgi:pimeloyl-ACP methyl ester carboxylesterase